MFRNLCRTLAEEPGDSVLCLVCCVQFAIYSVQCVVDKYIVCSVQCVVCETTAQSPRLLIPASARPVCKNGPADLGKDWQNLAIKRARY